MIRCFSFACSSESIWKEIELIKCKVRSALLPSTHTCTSTHVHTSTLTCPPVTFNLPPWFIHFFHSTPLTRHVPIKDPSSVYAHNTFNHLSVFAFEPTHTNTQTHTFTRNAFDFECRHNHFMSLLLPLLSLSLGARYFCRLFNFTSLWLVYLTCTSTFGLYASACYQAWFYAQW